MAFSALQGRSRRRSVAVTLDLQTTDHDDRAQELQRRGDDLSGDDAADGHRLLDVRDSHHIYLHRRAPAILNLQEVGGEVKPYQVRRLLDLLGRYDLVPEGLV